MVKRLGKALLMAALVLIVMACIYTAASERCGHNTADCSALVHSHKRAGGRAGRHRACAGGRTGETGGEYAAACITRQVPAHSILPLPQMLRRLRPSNGNGGTRKRGRHYCGGPARAEVRHKGRDCRRRYKNCAGLRQRRKRQGYRRFCGKTRGYLQAGV